MQYASSVDSHLFVKNPLQGVLQGLLQAATGNYLIEPSANRMGQLYRMIYQPPWIRFKALPHSW
jgi:hypothetical protein